MHADKQNQGGRIVRSVTYLSVAVNIALSAIKLAVGLLSGSLALMADGVHSLSDLATDGAVLVGVPALARGHWLRCNRIFNRLPEVHERIKTLEKKVKDLASSADH